MVRLARPLFFGVLVVALTCFSNGCKKKENEEGKGYQRALQRLHSAIAPRDFEWPLQRFSEIAKSAAPADLKLGARFELARGWLTLGLLTKNTRDQVEALRVLKATGWRDDGGSIVEAFEAVATADKIAGTDIVEYAKEGALLARAVSTDFGTRQERLRTVTDIALGNGVFSPIAAAWILTVVAELPPPKVRTGKQSVKLDRRQVDRDLGRVLRYACPNAGDLLKPTKIPVRAQRLQAWAKACVSEASWLKGKSPDEVAMQGPCASLDPLKEPSMEARRIVVAFFNVLLVAYERGGGGMKPPAIYSRFPAEYGCSVTGNLVEWLLAPETD